MDPQYERLKSRIKAFIILLNSENSSHQISAYKTQRWTKKHSDRALNSAMLQLPTFAWGKVLITRIDFFIQHSKVWGCWIWVFLKPLFVAMPFLTTWGHIDLNNCPTRHFVPLKIHVVVSHAEVVIHEAFFHMLPPCGLRWYCYRDGL